MQLKVNIPSREAKMRAHTATHLLHFALDTILGGTKQAGSLVDDDFLRFDFATKRPLGQEELTQIEKQINNRIYQAIPVEKKEMSYDEAINYGAKAFFEDKYGNVVRVVSIQESDEKIKNITRNENHILSLKSIELCGGTHVNNTKNIGAFTIISQEAVASGIRRITAITGPKTIENIHTLRSSLFTLSSSLDCQPKQIHDKLQKFLKDYEELKANYESVQTQMVSAQLQDLQKTAPEISFENSASGFVLNTTSTPLQELNFKTLVLQAKQLRADKDWLLVNDTGSFALYVGSGKFSAKEYTKQQGRKGGGSDQLVQGRDKKTTRLVND